MWDGGVEGVFEEFDVFGEDFDDGEVIVFCGVEYYFDYVVDLCGVGVCDEGGVVVEECVYWVNGLVEVVLWICF